MASALPNIWHHRKVADSAAKSCTICFKPSTSVLITPDNKDFFYICPGHLKDRGFCSPIVDQSEEAARKKAREEALAKEIELVKKEYEEKQKKKKEKKEKEKDDKKGKDKKEDKAEDEKDEKEKEDKIKDLEEKKTEQSQEPRVFSLQKNFYKMRIDRLKNAELAKRNRERLSNPSSFPAVPSGDPV